MSDSRHKTELRRALDWGKLAPLRLYAKSVADGVYAGAHRSRRRGAGIEFGGQRSYVPGDDLRFIDRHALLRHGELLVRQFETETDRTLCLLVDASASMSFRGEDAPAPKYAFAALIAAALTKIAVSSGDRVSLDWFGGERTLELPIAGGREAFERVVGALETAQPSADLKMDLGALERAVARVERRALRGASVVVLSDLLDLPEGALDVVSSLGARGKALVALRVLDPTELSFPFSGPLHLRALEGDTRVETDAIAARPQYLAALAAQTRAWTARLLTRNGSLVEASSGDDPVETVRGVLEALGGRL
ncbi:MAG TPA: DUF58 domain-containing protein [Polyangiaceae bacterium]|nr:DUF58 domain-containing protein [Polyangiaceae bacterium]